MTGIVVVPPVLTDQFDDVPNAGVLPPAATARYLPGQFQYAWVGLRLTAGAAGIPALQSEIDSLELSLGRSLHNSQLLFSIRRMDTVHNEVQQAIRPQAVALAVFGILGALAMLVLVGQGLAQLLSRSAGEISVLRAVGAGRGQAALAAGLESGIAVVAVVVLAVAGAYAVSPLAPVGPVRRFDRPGASRPTRSCWPAAARSWPSSCSACSRCWPGGRSARPGGSLRCDRQ